MTLEVTAYGESPLGYQWMFEGEAIPEATERTFTLDPITANDAGLYSVRVSDSTGAVESPTTLIAVDPAAPPTFVEIDWQDDPYLGRRIIIVAQHDGTQPATYEWFRDGVAIATTSYRTLELNPVISDDAGSYHVIVTNFAGSITSNTRELEPMEVQIPVFVTQPESKVLDYGDHYSVLVDAIGTPPLYLELLRGEEVVFERYAVSMWITVFSWLQSDAGEHRIRVSNDAGSVLSDPFEITVNPVDLPTLEVRDPEVTAQYGQNAQLVVYANSAELPTFRWFKDGILVPGATDRAFNIIDVSEQDVGSYHAEVSNSSGTVRSESIVLAIAHPRPPQIIYHPRSHTVRIEDIYYTTLGVTADTTSLMTYQWQRNHVNESGQTFSQYGFRRTVTDATGDYRAIVSNEHGDSVSDTAKVRMHPHFAPVFERHPSDTTAITGGILALQAEVDGEPIPSIQWFKDGVLQPGQNRAQFYVADTTADHAGTYHAVATNSAGSTQSIAASVSVVPLEPPLIYRHPSSYDVLPGQLVDLDVTLSEFGSRVVPDGTTIRWKHNGVDTGMTGYRIRITGEPENAGAYTAVATNEAGSVESEPGYVTISPSTDQPAIRQQRGSVSIAPDFSAGSTLQLFVDVRDESQPMQWFREGIAVPDGVHQSLMVPISETLPGTYVLEVTTPEGIESSHPINVAFHNHEVPPGFTRHPQPVTARRGETAWFSPTITGSSPRTFQWYHDGIPIDGADDDKLRIDDASESDIGAYYLEVTNAYGTARSSDSTLDLAPPITLHFRYQPASVHAKLQHSQSYLTARAGGEKPHNYQWVKNGVDIPGATSDTFAVSAHRDDGGTYHLKVSNGTETIVSDAVTVTLETEFIPTVFSQQPSSQSTFSGMPLTISTAIEDDAGLSLQWYRNGEQIAGANQSTLLISNPTAEDSGTYSLRATGDEGTSSSRAAEIEIITSEAPSISKQPSDREVRYGDTAELRVEATGVPAPSFMWSKDGVLLPEQTSAILRIEDFTSNEAGTYQVVALNFRGSAASREVDLTLAPPAVAHHGFRKKSGYREDETIEVTNRLVHSGPITELRWQLLVPEGWSIASSGGSLGDTVPSTGATGLAEWSWVPTEVNSTIIFTYQLNPPANSTDSVELVAMVSAVTATETIETLASPDPLKLSPHGKYHDGDHDHDHRISLAELLRIIEFYNAREGTQRTGSYRVDISRPDGFTPASTTDPIEPGERRHSADIDNDNQIDLSELLRVIEIYNHREGTSRTGGYRRAEGTVDGFTPGAGS